MPQVLPEEEAVSVSVICLVGGGGGEDHTAQVPCYKTPLPPGSPRFCCKR